MLYKNLPELKTIKNKVKYNLASLFSAEYHEE